MVVIKITAKTYAGEKAVMAAYKEPVTFKQRVAMRAAGVTESRQLSIEPVVLTLYIGVRGRGIGALQAKAEEWKKENEGLIVKNMRAYGAEPSDYVLEVF